MRFVFALVLLILLIPTAVSADPGVTVISTSGDGSWLDGTWYVDLLPGESKSTTLEFYNPSSEAVTVTTQTRPCSMDRGNIVVCFCTRTFTIEAKSSYFDTVGVTASGATTPGSYNVSLSVEPRHETIVEPSPEPKPDPTPDPDPGPETKPPVTDSDPEPDPEPTPKPPTRKPVTNRTMLIAAGALGVLSLTLIVVTKIRAKKAEKEEEESWSSKRKETEE